MDELEHEEQTSAAVESPVTQGTRVSEENIPEGMHTNSLSFLIFIYEKYI